MGGGGPLGGIILGRRGGSRFPGPVITRGNTQSAGTEKIARQSGGDAFKVDQSAAFETTLERLRQRYALYFKLPEGVKPGQERNVEVELTAAAQRRHNGADVRFRRLNDTSDPDSPAVSSNRPILTPDAGEDTPATTTAPPATEKKGGWRRLGASGGEGGAPGPLIRGSGTPAPVPARAPAPAAAAASTDPATPDAAAKKGGWRRVRPGEEP